MDDKTKSDVIDALKSAQSVLADLTNPKPAQSSLHVFAHCVAAEKKARDALAAITRS